MIRALRTCAATILLLAASAAFAHCHLFQIEQLFSNADGTVQFVVLHESGNADGENLWAGQELTFTENPSGYGMPPPAMRSLTFPSNLPSATTAGRRVLIATPGFATLGLVTPDFTMPARFLAVSGGTLTFNCSGSAVHYSSLPTDGVSALSSSGATIPYVATNFAGISASGIVPQIGVWWNKDESGTGYSIDIKNGIIVIIIYTYESSGHSEWYLSSGAMTDNNTKYTGPLDKYRNGQCISCAYSLPTKIGNDGAISITFTSATTAVVSLPNNRTTNITPLL